MSKLNPAEKRVLKSIAKSAVIYVATSIVINKTLDYYIKH